MFLSSALLVQHPQILKMRTFSYILFIYLSIIIFILPFRNNMITYHQSSMNEITCKKHYNVLRYRTNSLSPFKSLSATVIFLLVHAISMRCTSWNIQLLLPACLWDNSKSSSHLSFALIPTRTKHILLLFSRATTDSAISTHASDFSSAFLHSKSYPKANSVLVASCR